MSEDAKIDTGEIKEAAKTLDHVETKEKSATTKAVFKCESTGETKEIPAEVLEKMEKDEDITSLIPNCPDGTPMKIVVVKE